MNVVLHGIGCIGPGLTSATSALAVLRGDTRYQAAETVLAPPDILGPRERRRSNATVRAALSASAEAVEAASAYANCAAENLPMVFASAIGEGRMLHNILAAIADPEADVSPTHFHNSVHNAAVGYWSIAVRARTAATSIAAQNGSFAAGLLEAAVQVAATDHPVLFCAYDSPMPHPLAPAYDMLDSFAVAFVLGPHPSAPRIAADHKAETVQLELNLETTGPTDAAAILPELPDRLRKIERSNPAARALPLLAMLARRQAGDIWLPYHGEARLRLTVSFDAG